MRILLQSPRILHTGSPFNNKEKNVLLQNGRILEIGDKNYSADRVIKAEGMILSAGWLDIGTFVGDPGLEHKEDIDSLSRTAVSGGFTEVAVLPNTHPVVQTKNEVTYMTRNNENRLLQVHALGAVTKGTKGEELTDMIDLHHAGAVGFTDGLKPLWHTDVFYKALQYLQKVNGLLIEHAEDQWLNMFGQMHEGLQSTMLGMKGMPRIAEEIALNRNIDLLSYAGGKLHCSRLSTARSVDLVRAAKKKFNITCDIASYQAVLNDSYLSSFDTNYKVNPPLRERSDNEALLKGLKDGTIDVICSAHLPQDEESKNLEFDLADAGISSLPTVGCNLVTLSEQVEWETLIEKVTINPRALLGLEVPVLEPEAKANLTLFDPSRTWTLDEKTFFSKGKNSPWYGKQVTGKAVAVFNNGKSWIDKDEN
jgi:dihydroorotase